MRTWKAHSALCSNAIATHAGVDVTCMLTLATDWLKSQMYGTFAVDGNGTSCFLRDVNEPRKDLIGGYRSVHKVEIVVRYTSVGEPRCIVHLVVEPNHIGDSV